MEQDKLVTTTTNFLDVPHKQTAEAVIAAVVGGEINPIEAHMSIKRMENVFKLVSEDDGYREALINEVRKHGKGAKFKGHSITEQAVHTSYDFTACNDPLWNELASCIKQLTERQKLREEELKAGWPQNELGIPVRTVVIESLPTIVMEDVMQDAQIHPPVKRQKTGVVVRFGKE